MLWIVGIVRNVIDCLASRKSPGMPRLIFASVQDLDTGFTVHGEIKKMRLVNTQKVGVTAAPVTATGAPATVQPGSAVWESSDPSVATVEQDPSNELAAVVKAVPGASGATQIKITADADMGDGVRNIEASGAIEVVVPEAAGFAPLTFSSPEEQ